MAGAPHPLTFFAGVTGDDSEICPEHIRMESALQVDLTQMFEKQAEDFMDEDSETVRLEPKSAYRLERGQVFVLRNLRLPEPFISAATKPNQTVDFRLGQNHHPHIVTVFGSEASKGKVVQLLFQQFRLPQFLDRRRSLFSRDGTFHLINNDGFSLANELVAIYRHGHLYFRSLSIVGRFLDLSAYEAEATEEEIVAFLGDALFVPDDVSEIMTIIENDSWLRRRVASIHATGILRLVKPKSAAKKAKVFEIGIDTERQEDGTYKIRLPIEKKKLKQVVKFLNEEYFHGELSASLYETNSLRRLNAHS